MSDAPQAVPESMRSVTKFTEKHAHEVGLPSPEALNYMMSVAQMLLTSALITPDMEPTKDAIQALVAAKWEQSDIDEYRNKVIKSNAMAKMLVGREMHMEAMESLQDIDIVKGRIFVRYPQLIGQIIRKGFAVKWIERSNERAALSVTREGTEPELFEFTIEDAKRAGLTTGGKPEYNQYLLRPRVMLTSRVVSEAYRTTGGRSNVYTPEEKSEVVRAASTMDEATDADRQRMDLIEAKNDQFRVGLKAKPAPVVESTPEKTEPPKEATKAEPATTQPQTTTVAPVAPAASTTARPKVAPIATIVSYEIHSLRRDGTVERMESEDIAPAKEMAASRARMIATTVPGVYFVMERTGGVNSGSLKEVDKIDSTAPAPLPPAVPQATPESALKTRLGVIIKIVEAAVNKGVAEANLTPIKTVQARVKTFLQGWFGVAKLNDLPKDEAAYTEAFADLESCAYRDVNVLFSAPEDTGRRMAATSKGLEAYFANGAVTPWPADVQTLVRQFVRMYGHSLEDFKTFATHLGMDRMKDPLDVRASIRLCLASRSAGKFIRECEARNLSPKDSIEIIEFRKCGGNLDTADAKTVEDGINWAIEAIHEEAAKKAAAKPAEEEGDLFDQLP